MRSNYLKTLKTAVLAIDCSPPWSQRCLRPAAGQPDCGPCECNAARRFDGAHVGLHAAARRQSAPATCAA